MITCRLAILMEERGFTQTRLAELSGVHRNAIRKFVNGTWRGIHRETLERLCGVLRVSVGELLVRETVTWNDLDA